MSFSSLWKDFREGNKNHDQKKKLPLRVTELAQKCVAWVAAEVLNVGKRETAVAIIIPRFRALRYERLAL